MFNRREVLAGIGASALTAGQASAASPFLIARFGVNYVPSRNWYYCWNDWDASAIAHDFDAIAEFGADHIRIMLVWPYFQPNPATVSTAHLDRLDALMRLAAERNLDVLVTLFHYHASGSELHWAISSITDLTHSQNVG